MPVLNDAEKLYLGSILVDKVMYGESQIWPPLPFIQSIDPSSAEGTANVPLTIHGFDFVPGGFVWWVDANFPNNQPFGGAYSFADSTRITTTLHHLAVKDFLLWVASDPKGTGPDWVGGPVSNKVIFSVTQPPLHIDHIDPVTGPPESQLLDIYGTGFLPVWTGSTPYSTVGAYAFDDFFSIGDSIIFIDSTHIQVPDFWPAEADYQIVVLNHSASGPVIEESNTALFTCTDPSVVAPILNSIDPASAPPGPLGRAFNTYGSNFVSGADILFDGVPTVNKATFINAAMLSTNLGSEVDVPGTKQVTVRNPDGTVSNAMPFTVTLTKD
jgi:hypothetical protein